MKKIISIVIIRSNENMNISSQQLSGLVDALISKSPLSYEIEEELLIRPKLNIGIPLITTNKMLSLVSLLSNNDSEATIKNKSLIILTLLARDPENSTTMVEIKSHDILKSYLKDEDASVLGKERALGVLLNLTFLSENKKRLVEDKVHIELIEYLKNADASVLGEEWALGVLLKLTMLSENEQQLVEDKVHIELIEYLKNADVSVLGKERALAVLLNLTFLSENQQRLVEDKVHIELIEYLKDADASVLGKERAVGVLLNLSMLSENQQQLVEDKIHIELIEYLKDADASVLGKEWALGGLLSLADLPENQVEIQRVGGDDVSLTFLNDLNARDDLKKLSVKILELLVSNYDNTSCVVNKINDVTIQEMRRRLNDNWYKPEHSSIIFIFGRVNIFHDLLEVRGMAYNSLIEVAADRNDDFLSTKKLLAISELAMSLRYSAHLRPLNILLNSNF